jgi:YaiO family outer membrane protein
MRTAIYAGLVAGSVVLNAAGAFAGEGSSLRGLKPSREGLDGDAAATQPQAAGLKWQGPDTVPDLAPRLTLYGGTFETLHFHQGNDASITRGVYRPLGANVGGLGLGSANPLNDAIPKYTLYTRVAQSLPGGWGLGFGVSQSEYNFATTNLLSVSAERYFGSFRGAYTLYSNRSEGTALGSSRRVQVDYMYGDRNTVGLSYTTGRETDILGPAIGLPYTDSRDLALSGRHWLSPNWALTYDVLSGEQGTLIRRQGLRLGVSRSF